MTTLPWFESLTDSVSALGAASREARTAYRAAEAAEEHYRLDRLRPVDGQVTAHDNTATRSTVRPHDLAFFRIRDALANQVNVLAHLYVSMALAYAYGTTWAIAQVQTGKQPPHVELIRVDGYFAVAGPLAGITDLTRWNDWPKFTAAREAMLACEDAGDYADQLAEQDYLAEHEAADMHNAFDTATGLSDAAYAYGQLAESALRFALLDTRTNHRRT